jgi:hypothetical protein
MKKVHSTGSFLDKLYTRHNTVLRKSLTKLEKDYNIQPKIPDIINSAGIRSDKKGVESNYKVHLLLHKIRQVQLTEEDDYKNTFLYLVSVGSI